MKFNKWLGAGRLTKDMKIAYTSAGKCFGNFTLAVSGYKNKTTGKEDVSFIDCTLWGEKAENLNQYLTKGKEILVEGELKQSTWEKDGEKRSKIGITVLNIQFVGGDKKESGKTREELEGVEQEVFEDNIPF
jgi:single-strand DNA-binding protein